MQENESGQLEKASKRPCDNRQRRCRLNQATLELLDGAEVVPTSGSARAAFHHIHP